MMYMETLSRERSARPEQTHELYYVPGQAFSVYYDYSDVPVSPMYHVYR